MNPIKQFLNKITSFTKGSNTFRQMGSGGFSSAASFPFDLKRDLTLNDLEGAFDLNWFYLNPQLFYKIMPNIVFSNPTIGQAVESTVQSVNSGHYVVLNVGKRKNQRFIDDLHREINQTLLSLSEFDSIDLMIDRYIRYLEVYGVLAIQMIPNELGTGLAVLKYVSPDQLYFHQDAKTLKYKPYLLDSQKQAVGFDEESFIYHPLSTFEKPYGIPPLIRAVEQAFVQKKINSNLLTIADYFGVLGILIATLYDVDNQRKKVDGSLESEKEFRDRKTKEWASDQEALKRDIKSTITVRKVSAPDNGIKYSAQDLLQFTHIPLEVKGALELESINRRQMLDGLNVSELFLGNIPPGINKSVGELLRRKDEEKITTRRQRISAVLEKILSRHLFLSRNPVWDISIKWKESDIIGEKDRAEVQLIDRQKKSLLQKDLLLLNEKGLISNDEVLQRIGQKDKLDSDNNCVILELGKGAHSYQVKEIAEKKTMTQVLLKL